MKNIKRKILFCLLLTVAFLPVAAQTSAVGQTSQTVEETELRRRSFEKVWNTINEKHYDPTFGGVNWKKIREIYEPQALDAKDRQEFHALLRQMLGELKLSHFGIYPYSTASEPGASDSGGAIGIELKMIEGRPLVFRVPAGSPSEKAGLKPGYVIEKIDGKSVAELLASLEKRLTEREKNESIKKVYRERALEARLGGKIGSTVELEVRDGADRLQKIVILREAAKMEFSEAVGNFPPQEVVFESRLLTGNVGYIRFNIWVVPQIIKIRRAVKEFAGTKGIIFDVRGNPGGIGGIAPGVVGLLTTGQLSLGSMSGRESTQKFIAYPQSDPFTGPVCVLTDHGSASTSEIFAAGLQENNRARIVGETTAGAVLPSVFETLPTAAIFQYAIADYQSPKKVLIEGRGVKPDIPVAVTRRSLLEGKDLPLEAALKSILN